MLAQGPEVEAFETEFQALVDGRHCVAVNAGTSALHLGLLAGGVEAGDEVIVPSFTFAATANAVRLCRAVPIFVDIDPHTFCLDSAAVAAAVTSRTTAIMPVHLYGHPAAMDRLTEIGERHDLLILEDAAQAHGAALHGQTVGTWGRVAAFSFYPTKNMTTGEGGMIVTDDDDIARSARLLRNQGMESAYQNEVVGFNARMTDVAAAIGRVQLQKLDGWNGARRARAAQFDETLQGVTAPAVAEGAVHVYHQYTVRTPERDTLWQSLRDGGVGAAVYYPVPVHRLAPFASHVNLPETERAAAEVLSLPIRPDLTDAEAETIIDLVNA